MVFYLQESDDGSNNQLVALRKGIRQLFSVCSNEIVAYCLYDSSRGWFWQGAASMACWFVMIFSVDGGGQYVPLFSLAPPGWIKEIAGYRPYVPLALWVAEALALLTYRPINRVN